MASVRVKIIVESSADFPEVSVFVGLDSSGDGTISQSEILPAGQLADGNFLIDLIGPDDGTGNECRWLVFLQAPTNSTYQIDVTPSIGDPVSMSEKVVGTSNFVHVSGTLDLMENQS